MGLFTKGQAAVAATVYDKMKQYVAPKDGKVHVLMVNSFSKMCNQVFECEDKYTPQMDCIVTGLQSDGYEIVDIKFNSVKNQGAFGEAEGFHTMIMYK